ncbi:cytospin-B isoform X1 [Fukomys damarensis]|uniref:cytospin-B isoform X1 n=1 Tax=Fukomys damarensis TaxID=885580 RepID=UPI001454E9B5|nr:cytospin-B isoform X1 [Fukomys damarensis]
MLKPVLGVTVAVPTTKRTGIPTPRELSVTVSRERSVPRGPSNPRKSGSSPTSSCTHTPTKHLRTTSAKLKQENEAGEKAVLESRVRELLAEAKAKDSEINRLRSELKKCKERRALSTEGTDAADPSSDGTSFPPGNTEPLIRTLEEKNKTFQNELADLEDNRILKEKLTYLEQSPNSEGAASHTGDSSCPTSITQESSFGSPTGNELSSEIDEYKKNTYGNTLRTSGSSSSDVTKASLSPDASDFEHITTDTPSRTLSSTSNPFKNSKCSTTGSSPNNVSELSLASLTEKIQKMEENHHSTAEELQATLQELSDQQQMVQELTAENEKLVDEKTILESSFHQHRERAEQLSQENEKLINLLQERVKNDEPSAQEGKILDLEQRCTDILEKSRFEREKLLNIQQQLTCSLRKVEEENQGALNMIKHLKEENEKLNGFLELERCNSNVMTKTLEECRVTLEGLKIENGSLKAHLEGEKQKATETSSNLGQTTENCELQEMLKVARAEKDQLELSCTELRQELLKANGEIKHISSLLAKMEKDYSYLKEICDHQAEQLSKTSLKLQEKASESDAEIKDMKETIFELEDQVEQHRAVKLHNNQLISELESSVIKLEEQKSDLERQLKTLTKQIKEETEEWRRFQADLQTAVVVANDIKCEAQQELRTVKRRLLEEEEKNARLQKELGDIQGHSRPENEEPEPSEVNTAGRWHGVYVSRTSPAPAESATTVKSLIKSFDLGHPGGTGQNISIHKAPRSLLSGIPVRTTPAAAVSPMQRHSTYSSLRPASKGMTQRLDIPDLPLSGDYVFATDLLKGRTEDLKPDPYLRKSPSLESLSRPPSLGFGSTRLLSASTGGLKPPSKLSVERRDPLAALAREYGGSKRNALLKWCQKKTEGYANIDITNFSSSWSDGLAFCALLHTYLPAHIPYQELNSQEKKRNLLLAFEAAESVGIKPSLELSEMLYTDRPDWQSVMQYVAQIYKYFET